MTPNLKVDRKQLPVPPAAAAATTATVTVAPPATAAAAAAAEAKVSTDPAAPERQQKAPKKRGFWRSLGHALATPYREIAEASERIAAAEARDAAVQRVEEAVAALAGLDAPAAVPVAAEDTSKLETEISDIVFNVTGTRLEGPDASMEMIGLDSLGSMLVVASLRKQLGVAVAPSSIKEHGNSLQEFAQHIKSHRA